MQLYQAIASSLNALNNCIQNFNNLNGIELNELRLKDLLDRLPSGAGIDCGVKLDLDSSNDEKLVFNFSFHHMDQNGFYNGWEDYKLTVKPSFHGIDLKITGKNKNDIKEYLYDVFYTCLTEEIEKGK